MGRVGERTSRRPPQVCAVLLVLALAVGLAGCGARQQPRRQQGDAPSPAARPAFPVAPLTLVRPLEQDRLDATRSALEVPLRNDGRSPVTVESLRLDAPRFSAVDAVTSGQPMQPGQEVDFVVGYGDAVCPGDAGAADRVLLRARVGSGAAVDYQVAVPAPDAVAGRVHDPECRLRAVQHDFDVSLVADGAPTVVAGHPTLPLLLRVTRRTGSDALLVSEIDGSVLYDVSPRAVPAPVPLVRVAPTAAGADVPLRARVALCDPHGLTEAKKVYVFRIYAGLAGAAPEPVALSPGTDVQALLEGARRLCPILR